MKKKKFTVEDIKSYLEELGFIWVDKLVYNQYNRKYKKATLKDFIGDPIYLYLQNKINNHVAKILVKIDNETFIIKQATSKMEASAGWNEFLSAKSETLSV